MGCQTGLQSAIRCGQYGRFREQASIQGGCLSPCWRAGHSSGQSLVGQSRSLQPSSRLPGANAQLTTCLRTGPSVLTTSPVLPAPRICRGCLRAVVAKRSPNSHQHLERPHEHPDFTGSGEKPRNAHLRRGSTSRSASDPSRTHKRPSHAHCARGTELHTHPHAPLSIHLRKRPSRSVGAEVLLGEAKTDLELGP